MSIVGVFTRAQPSINGLAFDAVLEESSELVTDITEFPVESGTIGNDHALQRPLRITMTVGVSDNIFRAIASSAGNFSALAGIGLGGVAGRLIGRVGDLAAAAGLSASVINAAFAAGQDTTRSQTVLEAVRELQRANTIVDVVGAKREYKGCMIASTSQRTNNENEKGLELVVELKQLLIVNSRVEKEKIPAPDDTAETQTQERSNLGRLALQE